MKTREQHEHYEKFMRESNAIEGEFEPWSDHLGRLNPGDLEACEGFLKLQKITLKDIKTLHSVLGRHLQADWVGDWRKVNVWIGKFTPLDWPCLPDAMEKFIKGFPKMDSWEAHNMFETIHPFQDLNGRTGRLIWFWKAQKEGYNFDIPFLQQYYYQSLQHYHG